MAVKQFYKHCDTHSLLPTCQSAYRPHHSTETAIASVHNYIARAVDDGDICLLVLLDMSAAFDTVDHGILLDILDRRFGVQSNALDWFSSYLTGRTQSVCVSASISDPATLKCGVPQGSALGPVEFIVYTEELQDTIDVDYHLYADDIQLLARMQVADVDAKLQHVKQCVVSIKDCCSRRRLQLNPDKTELAWFGTRARLQQLNNQIVQFGQAVVKPSTSVRDLGVQLDSELTMKAHISKVASSCFFHLRRIRKLRTVLDVDLRKRLVCALVLSRIDYCNSVLAGLPNSTLAPLQRVLNAAARFVANLQPRDHVTDTLRALHWLPIRQRVSYKLCMLMHAVHFSYAPQYISDVVTPVSALSGRANLRSASNSNYDVQRTRLNIGRRAFSVAGPIAWNSLPSSLKEIRCLSTFKRLLKTHLFL